MVNGVDAGSECVELVVSVGLDWSWFLSGGFDLDEGDVSLGEDDDAVWDSGGAGAGEFPTQSAACADCFGKGLFDDGFTHGAPARIREGHRWHRCFRIAQRI